MNFLISFIRSSVGKKMIVAVSGLMLLMFVAGHLLGNLQVFLGPTWLNAYAHKLQSLGPFLWVIRLGLLAVVLTHIVATISLVIANRKARPLRYAKQAHQASTTASRTMAVSGLILLCFIIFHLLHFTVRVVPGQHFDASIVAADGREFPAMTMLDKHWGLQLSPMEPTEVHNTYAMMVAGFSYWYIAAFYLLGMFLLCMHLSHGVASFFQTLGLRNHRMASCLAIGARLLAWAIFAGYTSIPLAIFFGLVK